MDSITLNQYFPDRVEYPKFDYFVQIVETIIDGSSNMFIIKSSKLIEDRSRIHHNGVKIVLKNGLAFLKIRSLTEDQVEFAFTVNPQFRLDLD